MRAAISPFVTNMITSKAARRLRQLRASSGRILSGGRPTVHYFHDVADPYSHLTLQLIEPIREKYSVEVKMHLVPPPDDGAAPERERLSDYSLQDAQRLAEAHGLATPGRTRPATETVSRAIGAIAEVQDQPDHVARSLAISSALWSGESAFASAGNATSALEAGQRLRERLGHYLGATFYFEGDWYWGIDRLPYLEARLAKRRGSSAPLVRQLDVGAPAVNAAGTTIEFYASLRSPYTAISAKRIRQLAERHGATLEYRPVLPMVMRGLPVPSAKRLYILLDTKREAERLGLPFGRIVDPVGKGVERGLAVWHRAAREGLEAEFLESFFTGVWTEGVNPVSDAGMWKVARRAGLSRGMMDEGLADDGWRAIVEANRAKLFGLGLWGVPSFRVAQRPAIWGQDRLWAVEQDLIAEAKASE